MRSLSLSLSFDPSFSLLLRIPCFFSGIRILYLPRLFGPKTSAELPNGLKDLPRLLLPDSPRPAREETPAAGQPPRGHLRGGRGRQSQILPVSRLARNPGRQRLERPGNPTEPPPPPRDRPLRRVCQHLLQSIRTRLQFKPLPQLQALQKNLSQRTWNGEIRLRDHQVSVRQPGRRGSLPDQLDGVRGCLLRRGVTATRPPRRARGLPRNRNRNRVVRQSHELSHPCQARPSRASFGC